mmetsp:Transcript_23196/g.71303  ORF Transcript_23196/g.71303 Transcript_23196/m.71303 type:complete len:711 (+) Transcript_23196:107-2239(+)|eukprot:CAMPEP_0198665304 /NCGR_PEP_ID=MMETSP1467-20131203/59823_1 /TAXON_ID=1462469 /ORGANISM="unid. sp., Strain CCMP2135" /LENGTH=710 /DNA_ID=CAMNT_0044401889 /DNA_START=46 /DNA_END=2178 /DNA_ORIENTATION=+
MRLGTQTASPFELLSESVLSKPEVFHSDHDVVAAQARLLDVDETLAFWAALKSEATSRRKTFQRAQAKQLQRELEARFGRLNGMAKRSWMLMFLRWCSEQGETRWIGRPFLPLHALILIIFMAFRGRLPIIQLALLCCSLFVVHPLIVVLALVCLNRLLHDSPSSNELGLQSYLVRTSRQRQKERLATAATNALERKDLTTHWRHLQHVLPQVVDQLALKEMPENASHDIDVEFHGGSLLARLYAAALTSRAGRRVAVTLDEQDASEIELQPQCAPCAFPSSLHLGQFPSRYAPLFEAVTPLHRSLIFDTVGNPSTAYAYAIRVFGKGSSVVVIPAGVHRWLDVACQTTCINKPVLLNVLRHAHVVASDFLPHVVDASLADRVGDDIGSTLGNSWTSVISSHRFPIVGLMLSPVRILLSVVQKLIVSQRIGVSRNAFKAAASYSVMDALRKLVVHPNCELFDDEILRRESSTEDGTLEHSLQKLAGLNPLPARNFAEWCWGLSHSLAGFHRPLSPVDLYATLVHTISEHGGCFVPTPPSKASVSITFSIPSASPRRTLIAFKGEKTALDVPLDIPVLVDDARIMFFQVNQPATTSNLQIACVCEHVEPISVENVLANIANLFPSTDGNAIFAASLPPSVVKETKSCGGGGGGQASALREGAKPVQCDSIPGPAGAIAAGWLAAHKALGYTSMDMLNANRNLILDLAHPPL